MLPLNFHQTFIPERRLIGSLLDFVALGKQGSYSEIAEETGIPMGKYSGKVPAIMNYAKGMGLLYLGKADKAGVYKPKLTDFGKVVFLEDKLMGERIVQLLAHFNLCRDDIGALAWHTLFAEASSLGNSFTKAELDEFLAVRFGSANKRGRIGPMINVYIDDAALARSSVLKVSDERLRANTKININKIPLFETFARPYAAYITDLIELIFPKQIQVAITDFNIKTKWFNICKLQNDDIKTLFDLIERKGLLSFDRQRKPWIIEKRYSASDLWTQIFYDLA
ncbi:MAG: hypothetical protein AVO34_07630 [Firmicutes bacterium ML8_F2]|jgi:hypothetical protein|nr:MAG: hypothetical protein AVO34_07630 [Firmicutes bacterium ML8_F2]